MAEAVFPGTAVVINTAAVTPLLNGVVCYFWASAVFAGGFRIAEAINQPASG